MAENFSDQERAAVYKAIVLRRDIRRQFEASPIPHDVLVRILSAAHHAGSVGFMQPWISLLFNIAKVRKNVSIFFFAGVDVTQIFVDPRERDLFLPFCSEG